ncbi:hybrid sensor histidine kinase/response regulator transcription factor [Flavobacterium undicola]|uniref:hybrid sensor histidine kinase/response regulator transcription factor n=1 Tax=Flavobacterium undicola TaxID=1932779 RepID=UPI00137862A7|nr:two-component regulator propeller domain-containing protein [Flavobacterium undicola]MBA0882635.1 response regulator [Flavobacterium undicola]
MKTKRIFFLLSLFVLFASISCFSQSQVVFNKINQTNGLSTDRVRSIVKEKNGFVWIGTENGLNRYDGNKIKTYNKQNSVLSANDISDLLIDHKGKIWIATLGGGLNLYNPSNDKFVTYKNISNDANSIPSNELNTLFEDAKGTIWLGTKNGLCFFNPQKQTFKTYKFQANNEKSLSHNDVRSIYEDANKNLWIGTFGGGLNKFNPKTGQFVRINSSSNTSPDYIHSISGLNKNELLIGTSGKGLLTLDVNRLSFQKKAYGINKPVSIVRCIKRGKNGALWIGTDGNGVFKITNINSVKPIVVNYTNDSQLESSISSNAIYDLMEDESANIWLVTAWNGVDVLSFNKDYTFLPSSDKGEAPISVLSVYKNKDAFFMGLDGKGLTVVQEGTKAVKHYNSERKNSIGDNYIQYIKESSNGNLWIGTFVNGLVYFNYKTGVATQFKQEAGNPKSLSYNDVRYTVEDEKKNIWVATWGGGLNYFDTTTKEFTSYKKKSADPFSISSDNVISLQKDGNFIWLATFGGGVDLLDTKTKRFKVYKSSVNNQNSISSDYVYSILKDSKGNLWIGTAGEGINLLDKKTKKINRFENFKNVRYQTVTAIIEDNRGLIWFSTKQGIFNYNYTTKTFNSFSNLKGDYHINSCFKDAKGMLYFGCSKGVVEFNPKTIKTQNITPKVKFTSFKLFNKEVAVGEGEILENDIAFSKNVTLEYDQDVITFEFAAMRFPSSANCEYQIKMDNFDKNWRSIGKDGTATYTNLSPGKYLFKVRSRELGDDWVDKYTAVGITILKPFWLEWWAFLIYTLLIVLILYVFIKYIISWEKMKADLRFEKFTHEKDIELYNLKQDFFTNISHEIRTPVTLILSSINKLLKTNDFSEAHQQNPFGTIKKNGEYLLNLVNELLDFRKLEHQQISLKVVQEDWVKFSKEIYLSFKEFAHQKDIKFEFESSTEMIELWFDKNQMEKVLYNLFSNALKFTNAGGSIKLSITETDKKVQLELVDEGIGISKKHLSKIFNRFYQANDTTNVNGTGFGLGLTISNEIIKLHHGEITVKSKKGSGSTFIITLKKGNSFFNEDEIGGNETNEELIENYFTSNKNKEQITEQRIVAVDDALTKEQTLLIVEDNPDICNYIVELFSDEFIVLQAANGKEGLEIALDKMPDLIVSDVMMPVMDGIELTHNLKSNSSTSHIPVILLTARASFIHKMAGFETGADDYITKPFNESLLRARIKNILKNRARLHEIFRSEDFMPIGELTTNKSDQEFLQNLGNLIEENIDCNDFSVNIVVKHLGMSHSVIYKKLKILTGMSLVEYIREYKLKKAKQLLLKKENTVAEVCYLVGYSDRKYFSKLFKERFGENPSSLLKEK